MRIVNTEKFHALTTNTFKRIFLKRKFKTNSPSSKVMTIEFKVDSVLLFFVQVDYTIYQEKINICQTVILS